VLIVDNRIIRFCSLLSRRKKRAAILTRVNRSWNGKINRAGTCLVENDKYYATFIAICPGHPMSRVVMSCSYEQLSARRIDKRSRSIISSHRLPEYFSLRCRPISIILACVKIIIFAKQSRVTEIYAKNSFANELPFILCIAASSINGFQRVQNCKLLYFLLRYRLHISHSWSNRCYFYILHIEMNNLKNKFFDTLKVY